MFVLIFLIIVLVYVLLWYVFPLARGAWYEPSDDNEVRNMIYLSEAAPGKKAAELGSGDGRIVIALAKKGVEAHGYEVNPFLVYRARQNIKKAGLEGKAFIHWKSFWNVNFSDFDIVTIFQISYIMGKLEKKLFAELKPGALVISHHWTFPNIDPIAKRGDVYAYQQPEVIDIPPKS